MLTEEQIKSLVNHQVRHETRDDQLLMPWLPQTEITQRINEELEAEEAELRSEGLADLLAENLVVYIRS